MAKRSTGPPEPEIKTFSDPAEIDKAVDLLGRRLAEVRSLRESNVRFDHPSVETTEANIQNTILQIFGPRSPEYLRHRYFDIWDGSYYANQNEGYSQECFEKGITKSDAVIESLIGRLKEQREFLLPTVTKIEAPPTTRKVFVVHGRDDEMKQSVARFLEHLELRPIILNERSNEGRTIIEKFEANSDVPFAVVLLSPDDVGAERSDFEESPEKLSGRARQNVILELGYFLGRLSRKRVCALRKEDVEIPSDFSGVIYVDYDPPGTWRFLLAKEIKAAGIPVDLNKL